MVINDEAAAARRTLLTGKLCGIWKLESAAAAAIASSSLFLSSHRQIPLRLCNLGLAIDWIGKLGGGSKSINRSPDKTGPWI